MPNVFQNRKKALQQATDWADNSITNKLKVKPKDRQGVMQGYTVVDPNAGKVGGAAVGRAFKKAADTKAGFWNDVASTRVWAKPGPNYKKK